MLEVGVPLEAGGGVGALEAVLGGRAGRPPAARGPGTPAGSARPPAPRGPRRRRRRAGRREVRRGSRRPWSRAAVIVRSHSGVPASGRAPSWIATTSTAPDSMSPASACSALHSEPWRVDPPGTTSASRSPSHGVTASATAVLLAGADHEHDPGHVADLERGAHRPGQHGGVAERQQHLVHVGADPAAGAGGEDHDGGGHGRDPTDSCARRSSGSGPLAPGAAVAAGPGGCTGCGGLLTTLRPRVFTAVTRRNPALTLPA